MADFLVYAQISNGEVNDVSLQCLRKARDLADASGGRVDALALGAGIGDATGTLAGYGADGIFIVDHANLGNYLAAPFKDTIKAFLAGKSYAALLLPATTAGDDLAPLLAADLDAGCVIGAAGLSTDGDTVTAQRLEFDRKVHSHYKAVAGKLLIVTLSDGIADIGDADTARQAETTTVEIEVAASTKSRVVNRDVTAKTVNLKDAKIIVGAGAGVGSKENFEKILALAKALNAEIGATRAVVDAGWLPADHQIGQTGATVKPDAYIACGISGAVQHWVGMSEAKKIVSINTDKSCPMMKRSHYRVAGDLNDVIPKLIQLLA